MANVAPIIDFAGFDSDELGDAISITLEGLAFSEATMRATIDWNGQTDIPVTPGPEFGGKRIDEGGFRLEAKVKITVRNISFASGGGFPKEKQTILYKRSAGSTPKLYRIDAITNYYDAWMELNCNDPAQGA